MRSRSLEWHTIKNALRLSGCRIYEQGPRVGMLGRVIARKELHRQDWFVKFITPSYAPGNKFPSHFPAIYSVPVRWSVPPCTSDVLSALNHVLVSAGKPRLF